MPLTVLDFASCKYITNFFGTDILGLTAFFLQDVWTNIGLK